MLIVTRWLTTGRKARQYAAASLYEATSLREKVVESSVVDTTRHAEPSGDQRCRQTAPRTKARRRKVHADSCSLGWSIGSFVRLSSECVAACQRARCSRCVPSTIPIRHRSHPILHRSHPILHRSHHRILPSHPMDVPIPSLHPTTPWTSCLRR